MQLFPSPASSFINVMRASSKEKAIIILHFARKKSWSKTHTKMLLGSRRNFSNIYYVVVDMLGLFCQKFRSGRACQKSAYIKEKKPLQLIRVTLTRVSLGTDLHHGFFKSDP